VTPAEVDRLLELARAGWESGLPYAHGVELALEAILVSPSFLFRGEPQPRPDEARMVYPLDAHALASRLSYFLWSSMPDEALFAEAERGTLRDNLEPQVRRMLADPKSRALVDDFAGQWLELRSLEARSFDRERFPAFSEELRAAMRRETELLCAHIITEDRSVLEFLTAEYSFVNEPLARHYGIAGVESGERFERVSLESLPRRGVLTQGSILALTSNPTRTSPVKRGKWVLENLLNAPPPPPPPGVPELVESGRSETEEPEGTLRARMEQHRADPLCASCHERMDAIGFGLENFDALGRWREEDAGAPIDASGGLGQGETFAGPLELVRVLAGPRREQFVRGLAEKLLTYALGRGLEYYDRCAVDTICASVAREGYRFSALVLAIARSAPFQSRRGEGAR
jgi:hypothetical protein